MISTTSSLPVTKLIKPLLLVKSETVMLSATEDGDTNEAELLFIDEAPDKAVINIRIMPAMPKT